VAAKLVQRGRVAPSSSTSASSEPGSKRAWVKKKARGVGQVFGGFAKQKSTANEIKSLQEKLDKAITNFHVCGSSVSFDGRDSFAVVYRSLS
jgi:hypothetical protein